MNVNQAVYTHYCAALCSHPASVGYGFRSARQRWVLCQRSASSRFRPDPLLLEFAQLPSTQARIELQDHRHIFSNAKNNILTNTHCSVLWPAQMRPAGEFCPGCRLYMLLFLSNIHLLIVLSNEVCVSGKYWKTYAHAERTSPEFRLEVEC